MQARVLIGYNFFDGIRAFGPFERNDVDDARLEELHLRYQYSYQFKLFEIDVIKGQDYLVLSHSLLVGLQVVRAATENRAAFEDIADEKSIIAKMEK